MLCCEDLIGISFKSFLLQNWFRFLFRKKYSKNRLLTESEYEIQSDVQTKKALEELKAYCLSHECNAWKTISKLKDPIKY